LERRGEVRVAGIIEEQHPERARLFMQWKKMDWPIMIDSLNLLGVAAVPITLLIDEHGIIRAVQPSEAEFLDFVARSYDEMEKHAPVIPTLDGDDIFLWENASQVSKAIDSYERALANQDDGPTHFRLGTAYRRRYDSTERRGDDFAKAVEHWGRALDIDPNQYIWRRRIQQYGPRLAKPYSFYDWVVEAREAIGSRGETPVRLLAEPGGAELAHPAESFQTTDAPFREPDPRGRILRDEQGLINAETTVVPTVMPPGASVRVHVVFRPDLDIKAHWNNEVDDLVFWVDVPEGWRVDQPYLRVPIPPVPVSQEARKVEFELKSPAQVIGRHSTISHDLKWSDAPTTIPAYALYYVCEDVNGTCLYRRQDVPIQVRVR
jgi:hypothetical protein